jgi:hypothetical protein
VTRAPLRGHVLARHAPRIVAPGTRRSCDARRIAVLTRLSHLALAVVAVAALAIGAMACGNPHAYECNEACNLYKDCIDSEYDTATCETRCEAMSGSSSTFGDKATACHDCLGSGVCVDAGAFTCAQTCDTVVP